MISLKSDYDVVNSSNISNGCRRLEKSKLKCTSDKSCGIGGKCEDLWTETRCKCPLGKTGPNCESERVGTQICFFNKTHLSMKGYIFQTGSTFTGTGWISFLFTEMHQRRIHFQQHNTPVLTVSKQKRSSFKECKFVYVFLI